MTRVSFRHSHTPYLYNYSYQELSPAASCGCPSGARQCIMGSIGFAPDKWSQCSKDEVNKGFREYNLDRCLLNVPTTTLLGQRCGDSILEGDEECDCGSASVRATATVAYSDTSQLLCLSPAGVQGYML